MNTERFMSKQLHTIKPQASAKDALELMLKHNIHHLPVVDNSQGCLGLVTDHQILEQMASRTNLDAAVETFMRTDLPELSDEYSVEEVLRLLSENDVSGLPLTSKGKLVGIITESDMLKAMEVLLAKQKEDGSVVDQAEGWLADPLVQNIMRFFSNAGI